MTNQLFTEQELNAMRDNLLSTFKTRYSETSYLYTRGGDVVGLECTCCLTGPMSDIRIRFKLCNTKTATVKVFFGDEILACDHDAIRINEPQDFITFVKINIERAMQHI